jgi:hypothetical protein
LLELNPLLLEIWIFTADGKLQLLLHKLALKGTKIAALSST